MLKKPAGTVRTVWDVWTYDVWGNEKDGWEANDRCCINRKCVIYAPATIYNAGTEGEFRGAKPSDKQIKEALALLPSVIIDTDGDDTHIYISGTDDGYPIGELLCISHDSLSPVGECKPEFTKIYMGEGFE